MNTRSPSGSSTSAPARKAELAYQAVRRAIIEQALIPGTKLPEDHLGLQFGVSRTLIRSVLGRLASEGLVDIGNKRSATVAQPSLDEARAVFELRRCLEAEAVRLVIGRWQPAMGAELEGHVREEERTLRNGPVSASVRLAGEFHVRLAAMSGNALLARYLSEVVTRCSLILAVYGRPHSPECAVSEHQRLIEALRGKDAALAMRLMAEHLGAVESRALIPELPRDGSDLGAILARYAAELRPATAPVAIASAARRSARATRP